MNRWNLAGLAAAVVLASSCGGGDGKGLTEPAAGVLKLSLVTPNADDGALLVTITGASISQLEAAAASYLVYTAQPDSLTTRVLVTGNITAGPLLLLHVPDTHRRSAYHATVVQAASRATFAVQSVTAYSLSVTE